MKSVFITRDQRQMLGPGVTPPLGETSVIWPFAQATESIDEDSDSKSDVQISLLEVTYTKAKGKNNCLVKWQQRIMQCAKL